ncbi:DsrE family protein [Alkanindiges sp. WGS2144]|uniref:DsrE family protein n=1 Tax=Alkanindiges sp. WGS2144 TaxID=3366808 RepID=UPI003752245C
MSVKSVLVIMSQGPLAGQNLLEALSATLVLATFGLEVKVCLKDDALQLLVASLPQITTPVSFKPTYPMLESFEFYDLFPVWAWAQSAKEQVLLEGTSLPFEPVALTPERLSQFDHILYW